MLTFSFTVNAELLNAFGKGGSGGGFILYSIESNSSFSIGSPAVVSMWDGRSRLRKKGNDGKRDWTQPALTPAGGFLAPLAKGQKSKEDKPLPLLLKPGK